MIIIASREKATGKVITALRMTEQVGEEFKANLGNLPRLFLKIKKKRRAMLGRWRRS